MTTTNGAEVVEYPHLHASADALVVTSTTLRLEGLGGASSDTSDTTVSVPRSPEGTALIKFGSRYTVRLFMHRGNALALLPGGNIPLAAKKPWTAFGMPSEYAIAFQFHYQPDNLLWKVVGIEEEKLTVVTSGFDRDRVLDKPIGKRLEISGFPHPFKSVPIALGCCSPDWPPSVWQSVTLGPNGETTDYVPMLFVNVKADPNAALVEAEPLMCERVSIDGAVGTLSVSGNSQSLDTPVSLSFSGDLEVRPTSDHQLIKYALPGSASSLIVDGHELIPTRLDAIGPFWAALLGTVAAAFLVALIVTKGRMIQRWLLE